MDEGEAREQAVVEAIRRAYALVDPEHEHKAIRFPPAAILPYAEGLLAPDAPPLRERDVELVLRMLLPGVEPRFDDGSWTIAHQTIEEVLAPRQATLVDRPFERLRALVLRLESRTRRHLRAIDLALDLTVTALSVTSEVAPARRLVEQEAGLDAFLRATLYHHHWVARRLEGARLALGKALESRLADPAAPLEAAPLEGWTARLEALDDELDAAAERLADLAA